MSGIPQLKTVHKVQILTIKQPCLNKLSYFALKRANARLQFIDRMVQFPWMKEENQEGNISLFAEKVTKETKI